jgi:hypothetical protein
MANIYAFSENQTHCLSIQAMKDYASDCVATGTGINISKCRNS